jgi:UPF0042 nucleotide-binding protein
MSGAGLFTALKAFEDMGYESVDNLRLGMIETLVEESAGSRALAVAIDTRNAAFDVEDLLDLYHRLADRDDLKVKLIFLECSDETLLARFTETRRRHPLAFDRPVADGIRRERDMLLSVRHAADQLIDTSDLSQHDLRRLISGNFRIDQDAGLSIFVTSFSFKRGIPREADLVFDVRFLMNPYWDTALRPITGQDAAVAQYIKKDVAYQDFMDNLAGLVLPLLPRYQQEGKSYLTLAIGCTGGRHRSVLVAEEITTLLAASGYIVGLGHRDMERQKQRA